MALPGAVGTGFGGMLGGGAGGRTTFGPAVTLFAGFGETRAGGGRLGRLIRTVSFSTGTVGRLVGRGGKVIRTVSFFGSFMSAMVIE